MKLVIYLFCLFSLSAYAEETHIIFINTKPLDIKFKGYKFKFLDCFKIYNNSNHSVISDIKTGNITLKHNSYSEFIVNSACFSQNNPELLFIASNSFLGYNYFNADKTKISFKLIGKRDWLIPQQTISSHILTLNINDNSNT